MKINIGKWLRRQVFGSQPVTLGNAARLALGRLGYDTDSRLDIIRLLDDVVLGRLTVEDIVESIGYEGLRALDTETVRLISELQDLRRRWNGRE